MPTRDLVLCGKGFNVAKAHPIAFSVAEKGAEPSVVLRAFLRVDGVTGGGGGAHKRVRFGCADE
eukprot:2968033-Rhodomonas_salina.1